MSYTITKIVFTEYDGSRIEYTPNNPIVRYGNKKNVADRMCRNEEIRKSLCRDYGRDLVLCNARLIISRKRNKNTND